MEVIVRPSQPEDIDAIAPRMRDADKVEVMASAGRTPREALLESLDGSEVALTVVIDGIPEIMLGVATISAVTGTGCPWLLGTDAVKKHYREFLRQSPVFLKRLSHGYTRLVNIVDDRNTLSKRWLQWLGFTLAEPRPLGRNKEMFRVFEKRF